MIIIFHLISIVSHFFSKHPTYVCLWSCLLCKDYKDGESDTQFEQVNNKINKDISQHIFVSFYFTCHWPSRCLVWRWALVSCLQTCANLQKDYHPPITFIVIQKHRSTRFLIDGHNIKTIFCSVGNTFHGKTCKLFHLLSI